MSHGIEYSALSIQGLRDNNEDLCHVEYLADGRYLLAAVCDGVGGENGGEIAAYIAVKVLVNTLRENNEINLETLQMATVEANNAIIEQQMNPLYDRMGTCLSACVLSLETKEMFICHVGDTRIYSYGGATDEIKKLTPDHSYNGKLYDDGLITEQQAMGSPKRNRISRCLGSQILNYCDDYIYVTKLPMDGIDHLLLVSDGVHDVVSSPEIKEVLVSKHIPHSAAENLIQMAIRQGSRDNVSAIVINLFNK
ncbi:MAG: serine/threonine-protein phosphatase [Clostridiales bacterium]|nr:serine/threonine-protein phosphatase [Clostridiales bacterium]